MTDSSTGERMVVSTEGTAGPYLIVPLDQLSEVRKILTQSQVPHTVDENAVSFDEHPLLSVINLGLHVDPVKVQQILDRHETHTIEK